jgi:hypothetical protein
MALSKREHYIVVATITVIAALMLDRVAATPLLERRARANAAEQKTINGLERASLLFGRARRMNREWQGMLAHSIRGDVGQAESAVLHTLRDWSEDSGLALSSLKPERMPQEGPLSQVTIHAVGGGTMRSVARFLWLVETAELPLKVEEVQLHSRREGAADDLSFQMRLSALYVPLKADTPASEATTEPSAGGST